MSAFACALRDARYVAFGGCGTKGVSYIGCLKALQKHHAEHTGWHHRLLGACGSSSGCIAALAFVVNADADVLLERWRAMRATTMVPFVDFGAVLSRYGADAGEEVRHILREALSACGLAHDTTFRTLHRLTGRDLRLCVTNLNRCRLEVFSHTTTPDVVVRDAMYWSMTVPFVFQPESYGGDFMVDGCLLSYVPYDVWPLEETIVFHANGASLGEPDGGARRDVADIRTFANQVIRCCARSVLRTTHELSAAHPERFVRISVSDPMDTVLALDPSVLDDLVDAGFAAIFVKLHPQVALVFDRLMRMSIELQDKAYDIHEQM